MSSMKRCRVFAYISLVQVLLLAGAVVAAAVEIESIMLSGVVLSIFGVVVAGCTVVLVTAFWPARAVEAQNEKTTETRMEMVFFSMVFYLRVNRMPTSSAAI